MSLQRLTAEEFKALPRAKPNKYRARKTTVDGITFHSKGEADRWQELKVLERAGQITDLYRQQPLPLKVNGVLVCTLILDFTYVEDGKPIFEDFKGVVTKDWRIKSKLFTAITGHVVRVP